jgi:beta-glucosidase
VAVPAPDRDLPCDDEARALLARLSPTDKLRLLSGDTPFWAGMADIAIHDASHRHPWPGAHLPQLNLPDLSFVDGPRGVVLAGGATTFPVPIARGATWDPALERRIGAAIGREARAFGANWVAAVCVNLLRHPGWGRAQETYGEDPVHVGAMGAAMTRGLQRHVIACVKHLALNSIDSCRFIVDVQATRRVLHELYLPQFRDCVTAGAGSVMSAYNRVNGRWCGEHPELLNEILKARWGFDGFVVTDFIFGLHDGLAALKAGQDLEMPFQMIWHGCLAEAQAAGQLPMSRVDDAVLRQLRQRLRLNRVDHVPQPRRCSQHRQLARQAARESIVLLRNTPLDGGAPLLPLGPLRSLAVIGELAARANLGDRGSSDTRPPRGAVVTPVQGLRAARPGLPVHHDPGRDPRVAATLASRCDAAVVVVGLDWRHEGEHIHAGDIAPILRQTPPPQWLERRFDRGRLRRRWQPVASLLSWFTSHASAPLRGDFAAGDRTVLDLPADQVALIETVAAAQPRTVVVLMAGGALICGSWLQRVAAVLLLWYPGEQGGHALADVVFGAVSPSGRLPMTIPTTASHLPPFEPRARQIRYDLWHGYRRLQQQGHQAQFPFGFGLSYSRFVTTAPTAELMRHPSAEASIRLELTVTNAGPVNAATVVQIYLEPPAATIERPPRSLVAFVRVPLQPAEGRRLRLRIPLWRLACFDESCDCFVVQPGRHRLVVADHVEDPGQGVELDLQAESLGP